MDAVKMTDRRFRWCCGGDSVGTAEHGGDDSLGRIRQPAPDVEVVFAGVPPSVLVSVGQGRHRRRLQAGDGRVNADVNYEASSDLRQRHRVRQDRRRRDERRGRPCPVRWRRIALTPGSAPADTPRARSSRVFVDLRRHPGGKQTCEFRVYIPQPMPPQVADHVAAVSSSSENPRGKERDVPVRRTRAVATALRYAPETIEGCAVRRRDGNGTGQPSIAHAVCRRTG